MNPGAGSTSNTPMRGKQRRAGGTRSGGLLSVAGVLAALLGLAAPGATRAQVGLRVVRLDAEGAVRVDGSVREWDAVGVRWVRVGGTDDPSFRYALAYDGDGLYVAATVRDARVVRTRAADRDEDALVVTLALPDGRALRGLDVWLFPGVPGQLPAAARLARVGGGTLRPIPGARIVEGPTPERARGLALEAFLPWSSLPGAERWQEGRAALRYQDVDAEARPEVGAVVATSPVDPDGLRRLPALMPTGGESAVLRSFLRPRGLTAAPRRHDLRGNVAGDPRPERVVVVDRFAVVFGPGHRGGEGFDFVALPVRSGADVRGAELRDLTGDGVAELVLVYRVRDGDDSHDVWRVYDPEEGGIRPLLGLEVRRDGDGAVVDVPVRVQARRGGPPAITVRAAAAPDGGLPPARLEPDVQPLFVVGAGVRSRTWAWAGGRFDLVEEVPEPAPAEPARAAVRARGAAEPGRPPEPPPPAFDTSEAEAMARRRAGVGLRTPARHRTRANVFGDRRPEEVVVFGDTLFVWGPGYRDGTSIFSLSLSAAPEDVLALETADLTGDGVDEILLTRAERQQTDRGELVREVLSVHRLGENAFPRVLAAEVARALGSWRVEADVRLRGRGRRRALQIRPGTAHGVDVSNWPFGPEPTDVTPRPIPLPWRDRPVTFRWDGERLVPR